MATLKQALSDLYLRTGMGHREFCRRTGVSYRSLRRMINGERPCDEVLKLIKEMKK